MSSHQALSQLLHESDSYATAFNSIHASSFNMVQQVYSAIGQLRNLSGLPDTSGLKERGMVKVQVIIEEGLTSIRGELSKMEQVVEQLGNLVYQVDVFLAARTTVLQHGLNPKEALSHVSGLFASYQEELIRLREVLADFTCESIEPEEFVESWRHMREVDQGKAEEASELANMLNNWGGGL